MFEGSQGYGDAHVGVWQELARCGTAGGSARGVDGTHSCQVLEERSFIVGWREIPEAPIRADGYYEVLGQLSGDTGS
jgi:hypothetical protein